MQSLRLHWLCNILFFCLCFFSLCLSCHAQQARVSSSISDTEPLVGQPVTVSVKILIPTWFTKAVYFEEVEALNLITLKSSKSSYPTSEIVKGETWSGIIKEYHIIPMIEGTFTITLPEITLQYMSQDGQTQKHKVTPNPVKLKAFVPTEAKQLNPLIIANDIQLKDEYTEPETIQVGQNISRRLSIHVDGSSALFIPQLLQDIDPALGSTYYQSPQTKDQIDARTSAVKGTRIEQQDVLLQADGSVEFAAVRLHYFSPASGEIEEVLLEGKQIKVHGPPLTQVLFSRKGFTHIALLLLSIIISIPFVVWLWRLSKQQWQRYRHSEKYQYRLLYKACQHPDHHTLILWRQWQRHWQSIYANSPALHSDSKAFIISIESYIYQDSAKRNKHNFCLSLSQHRQNLLKTQMHKQQRLATLNPV